MPPKTVPFSVRITEDDAEFLSRLEFKGAKTPSDRFRALIAERRAAENEIEGYQAWFDEITRIMGPAVQKIRADEHGAGLSSELVKRSFEWLPDLLAFFLSYTSAQGEGTQPPLVELEKGLHERISRIMEGTLEMGASDFRLCYDPGTVKTRIASTMELSALMQEIMTRKKKEIGDE